MHPRQPVRAFQARYAGSIPTTRFSPGTLTAEGRQSA